ncbi:MAG: hypothetical protein WBG64_13845 [Thermoanaerobaculia bacterium]
MNLFDATHGNYRVVRTVTFPDFPDSELVLDVEVTATSPSEWITEMTINGTYDGPTDFVSKKDYQLDWATDGKSLIESGSATLESASGEAVRSTWSSVITPAGGLEGFPAAGEVVTVSISPFQVEGDSMTYEWEGTVQERSKAQ